MNAGKEMQDKVTDVIRIEVVERNMNARSEKLVPSQLIWALHDLVKET